MNNHVRQVINESYMHNVPKGSETHFKVVVVSPEFNEVSKQSSSKAMKQLFSLIQGEADWSSPTGQLLLGRRAQDWSARSFYSGGTPFRRPFEPHIDQ